MGGALVLRRRPAGQLAEPGAERAEAGEPDQVADLRDGQVHRPQQVLGPLDPAPGRRLLLAVWVVLSLIGLVTQLRVTGVGTAKKAAT